MRQSVLFSGECAISQTQSSRSSLKTGLCHNKLASHHLWLFSMVHTGFIPSCQAWDICILLPQQTKQAERARHYQKACLRKSVDWWAQCSLSPRGMQALTSFVSAASASYSMYARAHCASCMKWMQSLVFRSCQDSWQMSPYARVGSTLNSASHHSLLSFTHVCLMLKFVTTGQNMHAINKMMHSHRVLFTCTSGVCLKKCTKYIWYHMTTQDKLQAAIMKSSLQVAHLHAAFQVTYQLRSTDIVQNSPVHG